MPKLRSTYDGRKSGPGLETDCKRLVLTPTPRPDRREPDQHRDVGLQSSLVSSVERVLRVRRCLTRFTAAYIESRLSTADEPRNLQLRYRQRAADATADTLGQLSLASLRGR